MATRYKDDTNTYGFIYFRSVSLQLDQLKLKLSTQVVTITHRLYYSDDHQRLAIRHTRLSIESSQTSHT